MNGVYYDWKGNFLGVEKGEDMKKLFISVPMKGRTEEAIRESRQKLQKLAEVVTGENFEVIDTYVKHDPPKDSKAAVYYLGESIKKLSEADCFVGVDDMWEHPGCNAERAVARSYDIEVLCFPIEYVCSDIVEKRREAVPVCQIK